MTKNYILAFALSLGVLLLWSRLGPKAPSPTAPVAASLPERAAVPMAAAKSDLVVELGRNRISFTRRGAAVLQWEIRESEKESWTSLVPAQEAGLPVATFPDLDFSPQQKGDDIIFTAGRADGLRVTKTFHIDSDGHLHNVNLSLYNHGKSAIDATYEIGWGPGIEAGDEAGEKSRATRGVQRALAYDPPRLFKFKPSTQSGTYRWWGVDGHYFLAAFINAEQKPLTLRIDKDGAYFSVAEVEQLSLAPGQTAERSLPLYVGPKGYEYFKSLKLGLERSVDFGMFSPIGRFIHRFLRVAHRATHNYGWAIILMTILIQLAVLPLTVTSFRHTQKMKSLQPKLKQVQERFKSDPRRLQEETLKVYRDNGLHLMGMESCLPMLLQLPVFWALFSTLRSTYELRHAPWVGWIHDLSAHDPIYVLPVVMGGAMFFQQRMSTATLDPAQQKMMYFMPIMFTFFFLKMPAGLVIYWLTSSLISLLIQLILLKRQTSAA